MTGPSTISPYHDYCEGLWRTWIQGRLQRSPFLSDAFDMDAAPEPWLRLVAGPDPLYLLTTNPGGTLPLQRLDVIQRGESLVSPSDTYAEASSSFAKYYDESLQGPARYRIAAIQRLAELAGYRGVVQVESYPFHSARLPNKAALLRLASTDPLITEYVAALRQHLVERPVVVLSAVSTQAQLGGGALRPSPWLEWQADLIALDLEAATRVPLVRKEDVVTCAALVSRDDSQPKALVLMMGGNHFPGAAGLALLAEAVRRDPNNR